MNQVGQSRRTTRLREPETRPQDKLTFVPQSVWVPALNQPVTRRVVVTAAGHFPRAGHHVCHRTEGIPEAVLIVCADGGGWVEIGGVSLTVGPNEALMLPPNTGYSYGSDQSDPWTIWWVHLRGSDLRDLFTVAGASTQRPVVPVRTTERVLALLDEILSTLSRNFLREHLVGSSGAITRLFTQLSIDRTARSADDPLHRAMAHLADRFNHNLRVDELAHHVGLSASHLTALFHATTGGGVLAYQTTLRMAKARELLDTTRWSVAQVAHAVGYDDPFYFSRRFKRHHQLTPTQYRHRAKA